MANVTSEIILEQTVLTEGGNRRNRTLVIGTASRGPIGSPIVATQSTIGDIFGEVPQDGSRERSVVRAFHEINTCANNPIEIDVMRVGPARNASGTFYENQNQLSGDESYSLPAAPSIFIEMLVDGPEGNGVAVTITEDTISGKRVPTQMDITLPSSLLPLSSTGVAKTTLPLDPLHISGFGARNVVELATAINTNPNLLGVLRARPYILSKDVDINIVADASGDLVRLYDIGPAVPGINESWGDKLYAINEIVEMRDISVELDAGLGEYTLEVIPYKDDDPLTATVTAITRNVSNETIVRGIPSELGKNFADLSCSLFAGTIWNSGTVNVTKIEKHIGNDVWQELTAGADYTVNQALGRVTFTSLAFPTGFAYGSLVRATYDYPVDYVESHLRKDLQYGKEHSFFIAGDSIVFGANQSYPITIEYTARHVYKPGEVVIGDPSVPEPQRTQAGYKDILIYFNGPTLPEVGNTVRVSYQYMAELPAATGTVLDADGLGTTIVQTGALSGGSSGAAMTMKEYKNYLKEAYQDVANLPYRYIIPMGIYLDDVMNGYNYQTGLPEAQAANMHIDLINAVQDRSIKVAECQTIIPTRPPQDTVIDAATAKNWINRHIVVTTSDDPDEYIRPANLIVGLYGLSGAFRVSVPMGTPIGSVPQVDARQYILNPACVYVAMRYDLEAFNSGSSEEAEAMLNKPLPSIISDLAVRISDTDVIRQLSNLGYTPFVIDPVNGKPIIADAPTLAKNTQLDRQFVVDTMIEAIELVRAAVRPFLGKGKKISNIQAMKRAAGSAVGKLAPKRLTNYHVEIIEPPDAYITGNIDVELSLSTFVEIRNIRIKTRVKLS